MYIYAFHFDTGNRISGAGGYITHKAGPVVPVDVAPVMPLNKMRWPREKPAYNIGSIENIMHR